MIFALYSAQYGYLDSTGDVWTNDSGTMFGSFLDYREVFVVLPLADVEVHMAI